MMRYLKRFTDFVLEIYFDYHIKFSMIDYINKYMAIEYLNIATDLEFHEQFIFP